MIFVSYSIKSGRWAENMSNDYEFVKYKNRGAYHWGNVSHNLFKRNAFVIGRYRNMMSLLEQNVAGGLRGRTVLDVGCGDGVLSVCLAKKGALVHGVDNSSHALEYANSRTERKCVDVCFERGSAYSLPYHDESFDAIVSSDVMEHLHDTGGYLAEIRRVAKKDAVIVISTPIRFTENPLDPMHVFELFPGEFVSVISSLFDKTEFHYSHPVLWMEIYQRRLLYRMAINALSYVINPFSQIDPSHRLKALQYAVIRNR